MPDRIAAYVSRQVLEELLVKSAYISEPVKGVLTKESIQSIVKENVDHLKDFTFTNGLDLKTIVEDIRSNMHNEYENLNELSSAYQKARKSISQSLSTLINEIAVKLSNSSLSIVNKFQNEIPEETQTLFNKIQEQTLDKSKTHLTTHTTIDSANIFNWGKLDDISFLAQVKHHNGSITKIFTQKNLGVLEADKLATEASNITYPMNLIDKDLKGKILDHAKDHKDAIEHVLNLLTNIDDHRRFRNAIKIVFDSEFKSGRYNLPKFMTNLDNIHLGIEKLNDVIKSLEQEDTDVINDRLIILENQLMLSYGACQIIREHVMNNSLVIPVEINLNTDMPPRGHKLYFNNDTRSQLTDIEEPEKEVTKIYNHYHRAGFRIGVEGMSVNQYLKLKDSLNASVEEWIDRLHSDENQINFNIFKRTLSDVLKEDILNPVLESAEQRDKHKLMHIHDNKLESMYFNIAHDTDIKDELINYLVLMKNHDALESFQNSLYLSINDIKDDISDEEKKDFIHTNAYTKFIMTFFIDKNLIQHM